MLLQFDKISSCLSGESTLAKHIIDLIQIAQPPKSAAVLFIKPRRVWGKTALYHWLCYCFGLRTLN